MRSSANWQGPGLEPDRQGSPPPATAPARVGALEKVVLITPYGGGNLGDAAIQEAVIHNLRNRAGAVDIRMATLAPQRTEALHGLASFPLIAFEVSFYSEGILAQAPAGHSQAGAANTESMGSDGPPSFVSWVKAVLSKMPPLFRLLRWCKVALGRLVRIPIILSREIRHWVASYRFARGADCVIVSGGGQIDDYWGGPWGHPYSLMKWSIVARLVDARFVVLSTGVCALQSPLSRRLVKSALKRAAYRSYRDEGSRSLLAYLPFTADDPVYPDLAFSFPLERALAYERPDLRAELTVGISPIAYMGLNWPKQDTGTHEGYIATLTEFARGLLRRGYSIVLFSSDAADRHPTRAMLNALTAFSDIDANRVRCALPDTIDDLFAVLAQVDVVVASRLHGILLSHFVHKPVLAVSYDRKVDTHMDHMDQTEHCLDIHNIEQTALEAAFQSLLDHLGSTQRHVATISRRLSELAIAQYSRALGG